MKIIFMGTALFACPSLNKILQEKDFEVVGIYTREPKNAGRGQNIQISPIHQIGINNNIPIFYPKNFKEIESIKQFKSLNADIAVVVAYGLLIPKDILDIPKYGCINIHPSLLPRWRGAAPIQRTIIAADKITAVDIIQMNEGLDTGDILMRKEVILNGDETYQSLSLKLSSIGAEQLTELLKIIKSNKFNQINVINQNNKDATYASKITKEETIINWQEDCETIIRKIRGLSGSLTAQFNLNNNIIKIYDAKIIDKFSTNYPPSTILNNSLHIQCSRGVIQPTILQRQGKKIMEIKEFLLGFKL
ncbi:methionyl-tRNA formyltransferase [Alphaproteobacteria bacterium]|nr:methionyl-tRNA formyltransferase [Alphaproteobacteria bacterium]